SKQPHVISTQTNTKVSSIPSSDRSRVPPLISSVRDVPACRVSRIRRRSHSNYEVAVSAMKLAQITRPRGEFGTRRELTSRVLHGDSGLNNDEHTTADDDAREGWDAAQHRRRAAWHQADRAAARRNVRGSASSRGDPAGQQRRLAAPSFGRRAGDGPALHPPDR